MAQIRNPFEDIRVEGATGPRLLSRHDAVIRLESPRNTYLFGSRGSGKTSALLCLDWDERSKNLSLRKDIGSENTAFISVYSKVHHHLSNSIHVIPWDRVLPPELVANMAETYFGTLIELLAGEQLLNAISTMRSRSLVRFQFEHETATATAVYEFARRSRYQTPEEKFVDLAACEDWCRQYRLDLHRAGTRNQLQTAMDALPESRPGRFLNEVARLLRELITSDVQGNALSETFHFKVCFDEAETLSLGQQRVLNTIIRNSEAPLFWVVATVDRGFDATDTAEHGQSLTSADRQVVYLDGQGSDSEFKEFAQQIVSLRIRNALGCFETEEPTPDDHISVNFSALLGNFLVNTAIERLIGGSHSKFVRQLREDGAELDRLVAATKKDSGQSRDKLQSKHPSSYLSEAYLIKRLMPSSSLKDVVPSNSEEQKNFFASLRRKSYASLLNIVREGRFRFVPYFGDRSLLNLADGNIRELLEIMAELFEVIADDIPQDVDPTAIFAGRNRGSPIGWKQQRIAFERASNAKLAGIRNRHAEIGGSVSKIVSCLGELTYLLQTGPDALRTAERGNFEIHLDEISSYGGFDRNAVVTRTREVIDRCIEDSLLKDVGDDDQSIDLGNSVYHVRVHQRFAPTFKTSIRGAYSKQRIPANFIAEVCVNPVQVEKEEWARRAYTFLHEMDQQAEQGEFSWGMLGTNDLRDSTHGGYRLSDDE